MNLPPLREDLQLSSAGAALDGSPRWTLADPVRGRYFKLGATAIRLLRHWSLGDPQHVLQAANRVLPALARSRDERLIGRRHRRVAIGGLKRTVDLLDVEGDALRLREKLLGALHRLLKLLNR